MKNMAWMALILGACGPDKSPNDPSAAETSAADTDEETAATPTSAGGTSGTGETTAGSSGESDFAARCREFAAGPAGSALVMELCVCRVANGSAPDIATCIKDMTLGGGDDGTCMCDYYEDRPDGQAYIECLIAADDKAAACVAAAACDEDQVDVCFGAYSNDSSACPRPSEATLKGLQAACPAG